MNIMMNMLIKRVLVFDLLFITLTAFAQENNRLSPIEENQGWTLLFNGKDFNGWRQFNGTEMPINWKIEDEAMKVFLASGKAPGEGAGGDILFFENALLEIPRDRAELTRDAVLGLNKKRHVNWRQN